MDVRAYNREMWDKQVEMGNPWTIPVGSEVIARARNGNWSVVLTEKKAVPRDWFPADLHGVDVLGLASGGGQQGPVLAAAGANVTIFDNSPRQLERDRTVALREGLVINTVEGDMRDLHSFPDSSFDLIFHPVSNVFCPEVRPVYHEAFRVLRSGRIFMAGFMNPAMFIFDLQLAEMGEFILRHHLPFDATQISAEDRLRYFEDKYALEFSHSLTDQIGGQLEAGFVLTHLYEDEQESALGKFMPAYIATRARKP